MNMLERRMVDVLKDLNENHFVIGVKAEFEAEGTRMEEALRLKEVLSKAGLDLTIKIGGCEALKDMYDARSIGVNRIVAPMIESEYALRKFLEASKLAFPDDEREAIRFAINIETITACENLDKIFACATLKDLYAVVIGRSDLSVSLGLGRDDINSEKTFSYAAGVVKKAKTKGIAVGMGGGVSADSLDFFRRLPAGGVDYYETRKVMFKCPEAIGDNAKAGILKAVGFELMWLKNKQNYYAAIQHEDEGRIKLLSGKYSKMIEEAGGKYQ